MLEITMPYSPGHYANLPITTTAPAPVMMPPAFAFTSALFGLISCVGNIAFLAYGIGAIVTLVWFRRVLAAERERTVSGPVGFDPPATVPL